MRIFLLSDINHPCEMLSDMYSLSKFRNDFTKDKYLFVGIRGNIGLALKEASEIFEFYLKQCCPVGYEIEGIEVESNLYEAIKGMDIICTDSIPKESVWDFRNYQVISEMMSLANDNSILNPCPPFYRGEEVSEDIIRRNYFVGYEFKKYLLEIQQAIIIFNLLH